MEDKNLADFDKEVAVDFAVGAIVRGLEKIINAGDPRVRPEIAHEMQKLAGCVLNQGSCCAQPASVLTLKPLAIGYPAHKPKSTESVEPAYLSAVPAPVTESAPKTELGKKLLPKQIKQETGGRAESRADERSYRWDDEKDNGECKSLYNACREQIKSRESLDGSNLERRTTKILSAFKRIFTIPYIRLVERGCEILMHQKKANKTVQPLIDIDPKKIIVTDPERFTGDFENWYGQLSVAGQGPEISIISLAEKLVGAGAPAKALVKAYESQYTDGKLPGHLYFGRKGMWCTTDAGEAAEELERLSSREGISGGVIVRDGSRSA